MMIQNQNKLHPLLVGLLSIDTYDHDQKKSISVTSLLKGVQETILIQRYFNKLPRDIIGNYYTTYGQALHNFYEIHDLNAFKEAQLKSGVKKRIVSRFLLNPTNKQLKAYNKKHKKHPAIPIYQELRSYRKFKGKRLAGKFDACMGGIVRDLKVTSTFAYSKDDVWAYTMQLSLYKWLNPDIITENYGYIDFWFKDWAKAKAQACTDNTYPPTPIISKPLKLFSTKKVKKFLTKKFKQLEKATGCKDKKLPNCTDKERILAPPVFKFFGKPTNARATKVFDTYAEATEYARSRPDGVIRTVAGIYVKCQKFCPVAQVCKQYSGYIED